MPKKTLLTLSLIALLGSASTGLAETTLTIATVNNPDMIVMQKYAPEFEKETGIKLKWLTLEENVLRQRVTTDISTNGGQFDVITIGLLETPLWGKQGWLTPFDNLPASYDIDDVLPPIRSGLSYEGKLYSLPFYAESAITFYRKDLFDKAGITMPEKPTWDQIGQFADKVNDPSHGVYGVCLRGQPGWGENMAIIGVMAHMFGGQLFDANWKAQYDDEGWKKAVKFYVDLVHRDGPPGVVANGFNENLALFASGHCAMWVDASVAAGFLYDPKRSQVSDKVSFAQMPTEAAGIGNGWLWSWALAIPKSSKQVDAAKKFIEWATSKDYIKLIGEKEGWVTAPPGTRKSTYDNPEYQTVAPFAKITYDAITSISGMGMSKDKPYIGVTFAAIPEMQSIGTFAGQQMAAALTGKSSIDAALAATAQNADRTLQTAGGYQK
jgi:sorbitol/mannitol transport system substrate-binding protein